MMNCPYCGTENPADAKDCHNCSADLTSLAGENASPPVENDPLTGSASPPPESTAPTMISSSVEIAAMLAGDEAEKETASETESHSASEVASEEGEISESPSEEPPTEDAPDYAASTMMSSSEEVSGMLAGAGAEKEGLSEGDSTSIKSQPPDLNAPTLLGIPDPLGSMSDETPSPMEEVLPEHESEETSIPSPATDTTPKKDNRWLYILAGCGCLTIICICVIALSLVPYFQLQF